MSEHPLEPLLNPRSVAVVGASARPDTPGNDCLQLLERLGYDGVVHAVNPKYDSIGAVPCVGRIVDLPRNPDTVIISVANDRVEETLVEAIAHGARSAVIFGSCYLESDGEPKLTERLSAIAREAGIPLCGGNCIGAFNLEKRYAASWFPLKETFAGNVALVAHSGAIFVALVGLDFRLKFNVAVSAGQELVTTMADYLDYVLDLPSTRVVALFLETIRDPDGFERTMRKAQRKNIPIVALKVGRTAMSATLAESHSGAIAGNDAAYQALFDKYNVIRVDDADELAATATLLSTGKTVGSGRLAAVTDSGGARGMLIDRAADFGVPFTAIEAKTKAVLSSRLEYGLEAVNPVDVWGSGKDFVKVYEDCFTAITNDPGTSIGLSVLDVSLDDYISEGFVEAIRGTNDNTDKLVVVASNISRMPRDRLTRRLTECGVPVIDGVTVALKAIRKILAARDRTAVAGEVVPDGLNRRVTRKWIDRLSRVEPLSEVETYSLLADYGIPTIEYGLASTVEEVERLAETFGFPLVLKTAMPGIAHKSDVGGIRIGIDSLGSLRQAYADMSDRLGASVLVSRMAAKGHELAIGVVHDGQFGPLVMVGAGGVLIEFLKDVKFGLAPFGMDTAERMISELKLTALLDGMRGLPKVDRAALASILVRVSVLADDLRGVLGELDVNPVICSDEGIVAVDGFAKGLSTSV